MEVKNVNKKAEWAGPNGERERTQAVSRPAQEMEERKKFRGGTVIERGKRWVGKPKTVGSRKRGCPSPRDVLGGGGGLSNTKKKKKTKIHQQTDEGEWDPPGLGKKRND